MGCDKVNDATRVAYIDPIKERQYAVLDESHVPAALSERRLIGYARVSTDDQDLSLQIDGQGISDAVIPATHIGGGRDTCGQGPRGG